MLSFKPIKRALLLARQILFYMPVNQLRLTLKLLYLLTTRKKPRVIITQWYCRTGNNIQQILIALAHAEVFRGICAVGKESLEAAGLSKTISPITKDFAPERKEKTELRSRFFHFTEFAFNNNYPLRRLHFTQSYLVPRKECLLSRRWLEKNLHRIARDYLKEHVITRPDIESPGEKLVLHIRSGDTAALNCSGYMTNPLCFYRKLSLLFDSVIIVTEPENEHVLLKDICRLFKEYVIVSSSADKDFELLRQAVYLATSGVGTFSIAAAMLSDTLKALYCTDVFMDEHLNPRMIDRARVNVHLTELPGYTERWRKSKDRRSFLFDYQC